MIELPFRPKKAEPRSNSPQFNILSAEGLEIVVCSLLEGKEFSPKILQPGFRIKNDASGNLYFPGRMDNFSLVNYEIRSIHESQCRILVSDISPPIAPRPSHTLWTLDGEKVRYEPSAEVSQKLDELSGQYASQAISTYFNFPEEALALAQRGVNARDSNLSAWAVLLALTEMQEGQPDEFFRKLITKECDQEECEYLMNKTREIKLAIS